MDGGDTDPAELGRLDETMRLLVSGLEEFLEIRQEGDPSVRDRNTWQAALDTPLPNQGAGLDGVVDDLLRWVVPNGLRTPHPGFSGYILSRPSTAGILAGTAGMVAGHVRSFGSSFNHLEGVACGGCRGLRRSPWWSVCHFGWAAARKPSPGGLRILSVGPPKPNPRRTTPARRDPADNMLPCYPAEPFQRRITSSARPCARRRVRDWVGANRLSDGTMCEAIGRSGHTPPRQIGSDVSSRLARVAPALAVMATGVSALGQMPQVRPAFSDITAPSESVGFSRPVTLKGRCGGEPSIATGPAGRVYVTGWGPSDRSPDRCDLEETTVAEKPGLVYWVSSDGGVSFGDRRLTGTVHHALAQHTDVAVDARTGQVFVAGSEPFGAIYVCASNDHADSFTTYPSSSERCENQMNATGQLPAIDRPWLTHRPPKRAHPHHDLFLVAFSTGGSAANNVVWLSRDGGPWQPLGDPLLAGGAPPGTTTIVPAGKPALAPNGDVVHILLTQEPNKADHVQVRLARLSNPGEPNQTWELRTVYEFPCGSCVLSDIDPFAQVAVDGDSNLYVLFVHDITGGSDQAFHPYLWTSSDHGRTWSKPKKLNHDGHARALPAMLAGTRAGQLMIGWYHSTYKNPDGSPNPDQCAGESSVRPAEWHYEVVFSTDATSDTPDFQSTRLDNSEDSDDGDIVHYGGIHTRPGECNIGLGDFSSMAYDRYGCAVVAYADDHKHKPGDVGEWEIENNVARQTSGCFGDVD